MLEKKKLYSVLMFILFTAAACTPASQTLTGATQGGNASLGGSPSPKPSPSPTPTPTPSPSPSPTPTPTPSPTPGLPGPVPGGITIDPGQSYSGYYTDVNHVCSVVHASTSQCVSINGHSACTGFGPCMNLTSSNYTPPTPTPTPSPSPTPTPTPSPLPSPSPTPVPTPTPSPTPVPPGTDFCVGQPDVQYVDLGMNEHRYETRDHFPFMQDTIVVVRFTVPSIYTGRILDSSCVEYGGPPTYRQATISTSPCDFRMPDPNGVNGPIMFTGGVTVSSLLAIGPGASNPQVLPGQTYYFNIRNKMVDYDTGELKDSCTPGYICHADFQFMIR